jgi:hypothetical protein
MKVMNPMKGVDEDRRPGPVSRPATVEPGNSSVGMEDLDLVFLQNGRRQLDSAETESFAEWNRNMGKSAAPGFFDQRPSTRGTNEDFKTLGVQVLGQEKKRFLASAKRWAVDHLTNSYFFHRFAKV